MASRVLLISTNRCTIPDRVFPLGLAHLSAALHRAGHQVAWCDRLTEPHSLEETIESFQPRFIGISLRNIDNIAMVNQVTFFQEIAEVTAAVRRRVHCPIILGGSGFSLFPQRLLELSGADFGISGAGETAFPALLSALECGGDYQRLPGLVFRRDGGVCRNPPSDSPMAPPLSPEDRPRPVVAHYLKNGGVLNLQTQRGCAQRCCYCTYPLLEGRRHCSRPSEVVAEEMAQLQELGARYVFIVDAHFNSSAHHVAGICEAILRRNVKINWGCFLRPRGLSAGLMGLMARAGLTHVEFGSDSFCDEVLQAYQKDLTFDEIAQADEYARREKIEVCHFLIAGGPGETSDTLQSTFENSRRLARATIVVVAGMRIYPETPLCEIALRQGVITKETDLLRPAYYLAPGLERDEVLGRLRDFARISPNWIVGDPGPAYLALVERLRRRGARGPLWSFLAASQRLWPQPAGSAG